MVNVFADFETCIYIPNYNYNYRKDDKDKYKIIKSQGVVYPWLLCFKVEDSKNIIHSFGKHVEFFKFLDSLKGKVVLWFHNATYDLTSFLAPLGFTEYKITTKDTAGHQFIAGWFKLPGTGKKIYVGDTLLYERISLRKWGEQLNYPKGEIPYNMAEVQVVDGEDIGRESLVWYIDTETGEPMLYPLDKVLDYCKRDVELLELLYKAQIRKKIEMNKQVLGVHTNSIRQSTQSTHSRELLSLYMVSASFEQDFRTYVDPEDYLKMQSVGGFTSGTLSTPHYICKPGEVITSVDVNSMYPYIMSGPMPYKALVDTPPPLPHVTWYECKFKDLVWTGTMRDVENYPVPLTVQTLTAERTHFIPEDVYTFFKYEGVVKGEIKVINKVYQFTTTEVGRYMKFIYDKRLELKDRGIKTKRDKDEDSRLKVLMNSIYGKMCEKTRDEKTLYKKGQFVKEPIKGFRFKSTISGLYVAWMGRLIIYKHILEVLAAGYKFLYCDTDSIKFVHPKEANLKEIFKIGNRNLGDWKNEGTFHEFCSHVKKKYALINYDDPSKSKFALSGIDGALNLEAILIKGLSNGETFNTTLGHIRLLFNPKCNVVIRNGKRISALTDKYHQTFIRPGDFNSNPNCKNTIAVMTLDPEKESYTWETIDGKTI